MSTPHGDATDLFVGEVSTNKSYLSGFCHLCYKPVLILESLYDKERGWCHKTCVDSISTVGSR